MKKNIRQLNFSDERSNFTEQLAHINKNRHPIALLLDGLSDMRNVGSIFRLADAANLQKIYLHNCDFDPNHKKLIRTSRSTVQYVPFQVIENIEEINILQKEYEIVGLEITNQSIEYTKYKPKKPLLLVIGNEQNGISNELLQLTNACVHLPMYGVNTSMNVLCATGIAVYYFLEIMSNVRMSNE